MGVARPQIGGWILGERVFRVLPQQTFSGRLGLLQGAYDSGEAIGEGAILAKGGKEPLTRPWNHVASAHTHQTGGCRSGEVSAAETDFRSSPGSALCCDGDRGVGGGGRTKRPVRGIKAFSHNMTANKDSPRPNAPPSPLKERAPGAGPCIIELVSDRRFPEIPSMAAHVSELHISRLVKSIWDTVLVRSVHQVRGMTTDYPRFSYP